MAEEFSTKRIINLPDQSVYVNGDYVATDNATNGTKRFPVSGLVDAAMTGFASVYDATKTYAVGDFCVYGGTVYECTTAITTAEAWTAAHWKATTAGSEIANLKADLSEYESIFTGDVDESVKNWLDEHPEATTTVQDGSITAQKIANSAITKDKLSESVINQFIDGDANITRFENSDGQSTFVYWRYIPSDYIPHVAYSDGTDYAVKLASENGATCAVNASRWRTATKDFYGYFQVGENVLNTNEFEDSSISTDSRHILCCKNGVLSAQLIRTSTQDLIAQSYDWALTGFESIIIDGNPTERATPGNVLSTDFHPHSFIAQDYNGNYIIGSNDGRSARSKGFRLCDIYSFLVSIGHDIRFAYSLDGGGSVTLVEKGERINGYINNENREIKSIIYFKKPDAFYTDFLKSKVSNINNSFRSRINNYEYKEGDIYSYSSGSTKNIQFYDLETLSPQGYIRIQKDRFYVGLNNDFSDTGDPYNIVDVSKESFDYAGIRRYIARLTNNTIDYTDTIPNIGSTGINCVRITSSAIASSLGLTIDDYGFCILITFRANANFDVLLTRANIWYRYDLGIWRRLDYNEAVKTEITHDEYIEGDLYYIKSGNVVTIQANFYNNQSRSANSQIGSGLPGAFAPQNGLIFSSTNTYRLLVNDNGNLTVMDAMPTGYYRVSMTYIAS